MSGEGRYSAAWSELFALLVGRLLWLDLGILLWIGAHSREMPHWAALSIIAWIAQKFGAKGAAWRVIAPGYVGSVQARGRFHAERP